MGRTALLDHVDSERRSTIAEAVESCGEVIRGNTAWKAERRTLLSKCCSLFDADIAAVFLVHGDRVVLEDHIGYTRADGAKIPMSRLREHMTYRLTPKSQWGTVAFDGITGEVASRGSEFSINSWQEARSKRSHLGKPDELGIWGPERPFRCVFAVPLMLGNRTIGVLKVENKASSSGDESFDGVDRELLRKMASLFAMAIGYSHENFFLEATGPALLFDLDLAADSEPDAQEFRRLAEKFDLHSMADVIERTPGQIKFALADTDVPEIPKAAYKRVVLAGMGGSALPGNVLADAFEFSVPFLVCRNYNIPGGVDKRTLLVACSFSGNTEETVEAVESVPADCRGNVVVVTTGGKLQAIAEDRGYPIVRIPKLVPGESEERAPGGFQPRSATGYVATYIARVLSSAGVMSDPVAELRQLVPFLEGLADLRADAERVARWMIHRIPVIYTDERYVRSVARITKIKINENSKRPCFYNALPEANHNEMVGFTRPYGNYAFFHMQDPSSHPRVNRRFDIMRRTFSGVAYEHIEFDSWTMRGETPLEKIFSSLVFGDWLSYSLGLLDGVDPTPVEIVEGFKRALEAGD